MWAEGLDWLSLDSEELWLGSGQPGRARRDLKRHCQNCVWFLQKCHVPEECLHPDKCHFGIKSITRKMSNPPYTHRMSVSLFIPIFCFFIKRDLFILLQNCSALYLRKQAACCFFVIKILFPKSMFSIKNSCTNKSKSCKYCLWKYMFCYMLHINIYFLLEKMWVLLSVIFIFVSQREKLGWQKHDTGTLKLIKKTRPCDQGKDVCYRA